MHHGDDSKIRRFYDRLFEAAADIVREGEQHQPIVVVLEDSDRESVILVTNMDKDQLAAMLRTLAVAPGVSAVALIQEAWYAKLNPKDGLSLRRVLKQGASRDPGRREVMVFNLLTPTRQALMTCFIDRGSKILSKAGFEWLPDDGSSVTGRFIRTDGKRNR